MARVPSARIFLASPDDVTRATLLLQSHSIEVRGGASVYETSEEDGSEKASGLIVLSAGDRDRAMKLLAEAGIAAKVQT